MYKKILLATDGSKDSLKAAEEAIKLAKCQNYTKIYVVFVVSQSDAKKDVLRSWDEFGVYEKRKEKIAWIESMAKKELVKYEVKFLRGDPGEQLVQYANENHFDLIVMGTRGLSAVKELVVGSVSQKVIKKARCPVLVVKTKDS